MKKIIVLILILISLSLLSSCKTKRNIIKENDTKVATTQVVTSNDTTKWIREILDIINKQIVYKDKSSSTTTTTLIGSTENSSNNDTIVTTTTTHQKNDIELTIRVDIAKDETIKEQKDVHLTDSTTTINTSNVKEDVKDVKDTRLIQGVEWVYVIFTTMVVIGLIVVLVSYRR